MGNHNLQKAFHFATKDQFQKLNQVQFALDLLQDQAVMDLPVGKKENSMR
jgi:hypothetical protein